jgi:hypothetical protein
MADSSTPTARGQTPNEVARLLRVRPDRVRAWITSGELGAVNTAANTCGKPRFVILPRHLAEWERRRAAAPPPPPPRRRKRFFARDYFPDDEGGAT